jgi:hypothetical protein
MRVYNTLIYIVLHLRSHLRLHTLQASAYRQLRIWHAYYRQGRWSIFNRTIKLQSLVITALPLQIASLKSSGRFFEEVTNHIDCRTIKIYS